jgi:hypothetical protein
MTKTSKMLPPVAAVLPAEKGNETLVKWGLLPCCRFSRPLSINPVFLASLGGKSVVRWLPKTQIELAYSPALPPPPQFHRACSHG